ncbi:XkdX family protein [Peribacillus loiseleuriae]
MTWYDRIKKFYDEKLWTLSMVEDGVKCGKITIKQFTTITGEPYTA